MICSFVGMYKSELEPGIFSFDISKHTANIGDLLSRFIFGKKSGKSDNLLIFAMCEKLSKTK